MKNNNYRMGKTIKKITVLPGPFLKLLGKRDARKGDAVVSSQILKYLARCVAIEDGECLAAEEALKKARYEGAYYIQLVANSSEILSGLPKTFEATNALEILENRRRAQNFSNVSASLNQAKQRLCEINEELINGSTILDQRIMKTRKLAAAKIAAYVKGVQSGGLSFESEISFSDVAVDRYFHKHKSGDMAIATAAVSNVKEV